MKFKKTVPKPIGIIGGMGPQASSELYRLLIEGARCDYGARNNDDYPEILLDSVPIPDFLSDTSKMELAAKMLEDRIHRMSHYGISDLTLACNTACVLYDRLQTQTQVLLISIVKEVCREVSRRSKKVLILASPTSLRLQLYQYALESQGVSYITPHVFDYLQLEFIIRGVIEGNKQSVLMRKLVKITQRYTDDLTIDGIVLGCTELPLVFPQNYPLPVYSSLDILAKVLLKTYYYRKESV